MDKRIRDNILKKIDEFEHIPIFSEEIKKLVNNVDINEKDFIERLKYEIPVTANILKLANSSMYNLKVKVCSLKDIIDLLGFSELKKIFTMATATDIFSKGSGYEVSKGEMRRHSIASAVISKYLKPFFPKDLKDELFTACLLSDIGKIIISDEINTWNHKIKYLIENNDNISFIEAEKEVLGLTHAEIGSMILEKWNYSSEMIKAVRYHHEPDRVLDSPLTHFISLSDTLAMLLGFTTGIDGLEYKGFPELFKNYGIKQKDIEIILMDSVTEIKEVIPFDINSKSEVNNGL